MAPTFHQMLFSAGKDKQQTSAVICGAPLAKALSMNTILVLLSLRENKQPLQINWGTCYTVEPGLQVPRSS